jgi:hypothetical protein
VKEAQAPRPKPKLSPPLGILDMTLVYLTAVYSKDVLLGNSLAGKSTCFFNRDSLIFDAGSLLYRSLLFCLG